MYLVFKYNVNPRRKVSSPRKFDSIRITEGPAKQINQKLVSWHVFELITNLFYNLQPKPT